MAVLGPRLCARAFSSCGKRGPLFIAVRGPLTITASLVGSTGSRRAGSAVVAHGPSCSTACGIFPDQGSNPCPLHWQADSQPLRHQGSPHRNFLKLPKSILEQGEVINTENNQNKELVVGGREPWREWKISTRCAFAVTRIYLVGLCPFHPVLLPDDVHSSFSIAWILPSSLPFPTPPLKWGSKQPKHKRNNVPNYKILME